MREAGIFSPYRRRIERAHEEFLNESGFEIDADGTIDGDDIEISVMSKNKEKLLKDLIMTL